MTLTREEVECWLIDVFDDLEGGRKARILALIDERDSLKAGLHETIKAGCAEIARSRDAIAAERDSLARQLEGESARADRAESECLRFKELYQREANDVRLAMARADKAYADLQHWNERAEAAGYLDPAGVKVVREALNYIHRITPVGRAGDAIDAAAARALATLPKEAPDAGQDGGER